MTADCLPVLLCDDSGSVVGAAHAGWRGLCDGRDRAHRAGHACAAADADGLAGPGHRPAAFEVGDEVRAAFVAKQPQAAAAFVAVPGAGNK